MSDSPKVKAAFDPKKEAVSCLESRRDRISARLAGYRDQEQAAQSSLKTARAKILELGDALDKVVQDLAEAEKKLARARGEDQEMGGS